MASQLYFIVLTVCTRDVRNHDRLEWLLNRILSFSQSVHATYETMTDFHQYGACSGSPQLTPIASVNQELPAGINENSISGIHTYLFG